MPLPTHADALKVGPAAHWAWSDGYDAYQPDRTLNDTLLIAKFNFNLRGENPDSFEDYVHWFRGGWYAAKQQHDEQARQDTFIVTD